MRHTGTGKFRTGTPIFEIPVHRYDLCVPDASPPTRLKRPPQVAAAALAAAWSVAAAVLGALAAAMRAAAAYVFSDSELERMLF